MTNQTTTAISKATHHQQAIQLSGTYVDGRRVASLLEQAAREYHLVSPAPSCGMLPEGCSVALSTVLIDVAGETYSLGGDEGGRSGPKLGLSKSALDRISVALGVSWDPHLSRRLDDRSDPHYCLFQVVGHVRQFDGTTVTVMATKEMDMRRGSAQVEALVSRYESKRTAWERGGRKGYEPRSPDGQINEMRLHLVAHAESKAKNRAVRSLGVRTSYTRDELAKPFVCARLMFTGQSDDPELRRAFALRRADAMLGGASRASFGEATGPGMLLAAPISPPALGRRRDAASHDDIDELDTEERGAAAGDGPAVAADVPAPPPPAPPPGPPPVARPTARWEEPGTPPAGRELSGFTVPGGRDKGRPIEESSGETLDYWIRRIGDALKAGTTRDAERDRALLHGMRSELEFRTGGDANDEPGQDGSGAR